MQKEELKTLVKKYFQLTEINNTENSTEEVKEVSFAEATLVDGTKITNMLDAEFEVGQELHVITQEGEHVIAPSGEHTTESGIVITVDEEGKITGVARPDGADEGSLAEQEYTAEEAETFNEESVEKTTTEASKEELAEEEIIEELDEVKMEEKIIEAIAEIVAPEIEALKKKMEEHEEKLSQYMSAPASEPVEKAKAKLSATITSKDKVWEKEPFNQKKAQYDMILKAKSKTTNSQK